MKYEPKNGDMGLLDDNRNVVYKQGAWFWPQGKWNEKDEKQSIFVTKKPKIILMRGGKSFYINLCEED